MNNAVRQFVEKHSDKLIGDVIDVGGMDVNGGIRDLVPGKLTVTDMREGRGVDVVCPAENLAKHFGERSVDAIVSCETLEHMEDWRGCIKGMWDVVKDNGWLVMTMASMKKGRHNYPNDYWRAHIEHIYEIFPEADDVGHFGVSLGWVVKKTRELPDLSTINLIPVDEAKRWLR